MALQFISKDFYALSLDALYDIMHLRQEVFVVEQQCPYLDADHKDQQAYHLSVYDDAQLVAYARILPKGSSYEEYCSIGRVVTRPSHRRIQLGKKLMRFAIDECRLHYLGQDIKISAQCYLLDFYRGFQFEDVGDEYLEDDIPHKAMIRRQS